MANSVLQNLTGGSGSGSTSASAAGNYGVNTTAGSVLILVAKASCDNTSGLLTLTAAVGGGYSGSWGAAVYPYSSTYSWYDSVGAAFVQGITSIFFITNAPSMTTGMSVSITAANPNAGTMICYFELYEISMLGGGLFVSSQGANENSGAGSTNPNVGTISTTATDFILIAADTKASPALSAAAPYTYSASTGGQATSQYVLNEPASGSVPSNFTGTATFWSAVGVVFTSNGVGTYLAGITAASAMGTATGDIEATCFPAGVQAHIAMGTVSVPQPGPGLGSFEVRLSDDSWGCDNGGNLIGRYTTQTFNIPRLKRNQVIYVKIQDGRNNILSSEVWVNGGAGSVYQTGVWVNTGDWSLVQAYDYQHNLKLINSKVMMTGDSTSQTTLAYLNLSPNISYSASVDIKGTAGNYVVLGLIPSVSSSYIPPAYQAYKLTGSWQRVSVSTTASNTAPSLNTMSMQFTITPGVGGAHGVPGGYTFPGGGVQVYGTRASLEQAAAETVYCKTQSNGVALAVLAPYGALSRYASSIKCGYPFPPNAPTGFCNASDPVNPIINLTLPNVADDVWGVEIRAVDNVTVLYQSSLTDSSYAPTYTVANNTQSSLTFYLYTYNLLGEYSPSYKLTATILTFPTVSSLSFNAGTSVLSWSGANAVSYAVEVLNNINTPVFNTSQSGTSVTIPGGDITHPTYFIVTPYDSAGSPGIPANLTQA